MELLSDQDLKVYAQQLKLPLLAVLQKDMFRNIIPQIGAYIINLESSTVGNGTHWTGLFITEKYAIYYDPYGLPIPTPLIKFIYKSIFKLKIIYSTDQIQEMNSVFCGWFVLYFIYFFNHYHKVADKKFLLNKHNSLYSLKLKYLNDKILQKLITQITKHTFRK